MQLFSHSYPRYCVKTLQGHDEWVRCVVASADGKYLASGSNDQTVKVWSVESSTCVVTLRDHTHVIEAVAFAPEAGRLAIIESLGPAGNTVAILSNLSSLRV